MSTCGNCDCADKSQCVKKGNTYGVVIFETEKRDLAAPLRRLSRWQRTMASASAAPTAPAMVVPAANETVGVTL